MCLILPAPVWLSSRKTVFCCIAGRDGTTPQPDATNAGDNKPPQIKRRSALIGTLALCRGKTRLLPSPYSKSRFRKASCRYDELFAKCTATRSSDGTTYNACPAEPLA